MGGTPNVIATFVTTTSYGTWMPGDARGYVDRGAIMPASLPLLGHARGTLHRRPVHFNAADADALHEAIVHAADEFGYHITDLTIESWHLHWIVEHGFDTVPTVVGRLKTRMRQALGRGRTWTTGYHHRCLYDERALSFARDYIARHPGIRIIDGRTIRDPSPAKRRGSGPTRRPPHA
jgi:REP element-mobilizing transposase RayT